MSANPSTQQIAEHMAITGKPYTAAMLGKELGITAAVASSKLFNIRNTPRYKVEVSDLPHRTVRVISISGCSSSEDLWNLALFGKARRATA